MRGALGGRAEGTTRRKQGAIFLADKALTSDADGSPKEKVYGRLKKDRDNRNCD